MTAAYEAMEWAEAYKEGKKMTTSCCPAFVNLIKKHYPTLIDNLSTTVSPMCAVSRMLKAKDPETVTVFIGPCMAKKAEAADKSVEGNADFVLTFGEAIELMRAKDVELEPEEYKDQEASVFGKRFGNGGGVTNAVVQCLKEQGENTDIKVARCSGPVDVKKALLLMKVGRLPEDFIEGMMCQGGCVGGPSNLKQETTFKKDRDALIGKADERGVWENLKNYDMESFSMHRTQQAGNGEHMETDAFTFHPLHHRPAGGDLIQHGGPDVHRKDRKRDHGHGGLKRVPSADYLYHCVHKISGDRRRALMRH